MKNQTAEILGEPMRKTWKDRYSLTPEEFLERYIGPAVEAGLSAVARKYGAPPDRLNDPSE